MSVHDLAGKHRRCFKIRPTASLPLSFVAQRTALYASLLRTSGALHLTIFEQPLRARAVENRRFAAGILVETPWSSSFE